MVKRPLIAMVVVLVVVACGNKSPNTAANGPTAASVSVQSGDLPSGMQKCDISGDIESFLTKAKTKDPTTYTSTKKEWDDAKKNGATAAYVALYSDNAIHCSSVLTNSSDISAATYKLVVNFVIQFKDEATATKGYSSQSIFGFSAPALKGGGAPVIEGTKTGLSANSIVLSIAISNQSFYVAVWQNKAFMVILAVLNVDSAAAKKVALAENSRIT